MSHYKATCNVTSLGLASHTPYYKNINLSLPFVGTFYQLGEQSKINKILKLHIFNIQQKACAVMISKTVFTQNTLTFCHI